LPVGGTSDARPCEEIEARLKASYTKDERIEEVNTPPAKAGGFG